MTETTQVFCQYCGKPAQFLESSASVYRRDYGPIWICFTCDARVGCHPDNSPKGTLANAPLREARKAAHAVFDPLWRDWRTAYPPGERIGGHVGKLARTRTYEWMAEQLAIPFDAMHVAMFDEAQCARVVEVIARENPTPSSVREWAKQRRAAA